IGSPNGTLDLALNPSLLGTLNLPTGGGLIASDITSNAYLFLGFTGPLPVNYLSFTGTTENTGVSLNWSTAQEQNSNYFEVQRSTDNSNYVAIGQVTAAHNSSLPTNYSFTDASPASGNNYYRLKEVDLDGNFMYSKIVVVNFGVTGQNVVAVYPNPAHESFQLQFKNMQTGKYEMSLLSPVGQVIQSRSIQVSNPASYIETVPLNSGLAEGAYIVRLIDQQHHVYISKVVVR
ncbi:MAG TPA: T9SS type A sorting domain-containing protein, partial [Puia sp.]